MKQSSVRSLIASAANTLREAGVDSPEVDARLLAAHVLGVAPMQLMFADAPADFGERYTELVDFGTGAHRSKTGRGYVDADIETLSQAGMASGFASVLVLALYIDSADVRQLYAHPWLMWPLCPLVLYIIVRIWILARRNEMHEDPVVFILRDWRSQIMIALGALLFVVAAYV